MKLSSDSAEVATLIANSSPEPTPSTPAPADPAAPTEPVASAAPVAPVAPTSPVAPVAPVPTHAPVLPNLQIPVLPPVVPTAPVAPVPQAAPAPTPAPEPAAPLTGAPKTVAEGGTALPPHLVEQTGGRFQTVEALIESQTNAQRRITELSQPQPQPQPTPPQGAQPIELDDEFRRSVQADFMANGQFSDETRTGLAARGMAPSVVAEIESGLKAKGSLYRAQLLSEVGSVQAYNDLMAWSANNLPAHEVAAADQALNSFDMRQAVPMLRGMIARYEQARGLNQGTLEPQTQPVGGTGPQPFHSQTEMAAAQADPRYNTAIDPAYVRDVEARIQASVMAGTL